MIGQAREQASDEAKRPSDQPAAQQSTASESSSRPGAIEPGSATESTDQESTATFSSPIANTKGGREKPHAAPLSAVAILIAALTVRLWFNFIDIHANLAGCCDASEYVRNARAIGKLATIDPSFFTDLLRSSTALLSAQHMQATQPPQPFEQALASLHEVYQGGPIFPLFLLGSLALGSLFSGSDWLSLSQADLPHLLDWPVLVQSLLSALTCVLIARIASRAWTLPVGILAGLIAATYPAFIVNSQRLYTETFATTLVTAILCLIVEGFFTDKKSTARAFLTGVLAACLQLTRSVMVVLSLASLPILWLQTRAEKRSRKTVTALLAGMALVVVPWVAVANLAFGKGGVVIDRVGNYNLFIGTNTKTQGWLTIPYPDGAGIEEQSLTALLQSSFKENPRRFMQLLLDKPARLFSLPWNDFRTSIGPFSAKSQALYHQLILLLAAIGFLLTLFSDASADVPPREKLFSRLLLFAFVAFHFIYCFFITVPRYNLTAMPSLICFAAAGMAGLTTLLRNTRSHQAGLRLAIASVVLLALERTNLIPFLMLWQGVPWLATPGNALIAACLIKTAALIMFACQAFVCISHVSGYRRLARLSLIAAALILAAPLCLPVRALGRLFEWQCPLAYRGQLLEQVIELPAAPVSQSRDYQGTYLMVDADRTSTLQNLSITLNGTELTGPFIPGLSVIQDFATLRHTDRDGNVWFEGESMFNYLSRPADLTNLDLRQWVLIPVPANLARQCFADRQAKIDMTVTRPGGIIYGAYQNKAGRHEMPSPSVYSWEKAFYGVEEEGATTDPRLDYTLAVVSPGASRDLSPAPGLQTGFYNVRLLVDDHNQSAADSHNQATARAAGKSSDGKSPGSGAAKPGTFSSDQGGLIKRTALKLPVLSESEKETAAFAVKSIPAYKPGDLWLMRVHGKLRTLAGRPLPSLSITARAGKLKYDSPFTPCNIAGGRGEIEREIDFAAPLAPGAMPGKLSEIDTVFNINSRHWKLDRVISLENAQLEGKNIDLDLIRLSVPPFSPGYKIF